MQYKLYTKVNNEIKEHIINAQSCKKAYEELKKNGYESKNITLSGYI